VKLALMLLPGWWSRRKCCCQAGEAGANAAARLMKPAQILLPSWWSWRKYCCQAGVAGAYLRCLTVFAFLVWLVAAVAMVPEILQATAILESKSFSSY